MRRRSSLRTWAAALALWPAAAHAGPRDLFDLPAHPVAPPPACVSSDADDAIARCALPTDPLDDATPTALATYLPAGYLRALPGNAPTHDALAGITLGATTDSGGVALGGATSLEDRWTLDGAPIDDVATGGVGARIPLAFLDRLLVRAGGFLARDRASSGGTIDATLRAGTAHHQLAAEATASWTAAPRALPIATASYLVRKTALSDGPRLTAALVATGPLPRGAWYVAGLAPDLALPVLHLQADRLTDRDGDGSPDGLPGFAVTEPIERSDVRQLAWTVPALLRAGVATGHHHLDLTLLGRAGHDTRFTGDATLQAAGVDRMTYTGDAIATDRARWSDTTLKLQLAWHAGLRRESAHDPAAAALPQRLTATVPTTLLEDPALAAACSDVAPGDPYPKIPNCPVPVGWFTSGGAGRLNDVDAHRLTATADLARRLGGHVVRGGATVEASALTQRARFTGGYLERSLFDGHADDERFIDRGQPCEPGAAAPCGYVGVAERRAPTVTTAAYLEDAWRPRPDLTLDGGLRWETWRLGDRLRFNGDLAPRLGATWDPLGGGRSRVWTSAGRTYTALPAGLGATLLAGDATVHDVTSPFGASRTIDLAAPQPIMPGIRPMASDEVTAGAELALPRALRAVAWAQARWVRDGLATTPAGFGNPSSDGGAPAALRQSQTFAIEVQTAATAALSLRVGYSYGHATGTFTGAYDPRQGAALYAGDDYAVATANLRGPLPTDLGHRLFVEGRRAGHLGPVAIAVATRLRVGSGRPHDVLALSDDGVAELLPRGALGRGPLVATADLRLAATWRGTDLTLDVLDLFDRQPATAVDAFYAGGAVRPISGGDLTDLVFLTNDAGAAVRRRVGFQLPQAYATPTTIIFGVRREL